jgi:hypothetical protein
MDLLLPRVDKKQTLARSEEAFQKASPNDFGRGLERMGRIVADKRSSATIRVIGVIGVIGVIRVRKCWSFVEEAPADLREVFTQSLAR